MHDAIKRLLDLARRTGDRLIVTDPEGREPYVLLSLDQYEELLGGPLEEAPLPPPPPKEAASETSAPPVELRSPPVATDASAIAAADDSPRAIPVRRLDADPAQIPAPIPPVSSVEDDQTGEAGEEQFYLEPVE